METNVAENPEAQEKNNNRAKEKEISVQKAERSIRIACLAGVAVSLPGLIGYPLASASGVILMWIGLLMAGASFISGFFTGTLFGIPKRNNNGDSDYALNNSLVEIAEWLTKIIVGLGLVNLKQIPVYLLSMGEYVNRAANGANTASKWPSVFTICVVIYFGILGLYIGYNYMRLVLSQKYKTADDNLMAEKLKEAKKEIEQTKKEVKQKEFVIEEQIQKTNTLKNKSKQLLNIINDPNILSSALNATTRKNIVTESNDIQEDYVKDMLAKAKEKLQKGRILNKGLDDPQKGMWGGKAEANNRRLSAAVETKFTGIYKITMTVESTHPDVPLEQNEVILFALHDTWADPNYLVKVKDGKATLEVFAYGSFTVGAFADKGATELELNLAALPGVDKHFREN